MRKQSNRRPNRSRSARKDRKRKSNVSTEVPGSKDFLELQGEVLELLPAATFKVLLENGQEILAHLSGKMRMYKIKLLPGDKVKIQMSPYDLTKGRVTYRF